MTTCPSDSAISLLIATPPGHESDAADDHVSTCPRCQRRLDELTDVAGLSTVMRGPTVDRATSSPSLQVAIAKLTAEAPTGTHQATLPNLPASVRPGFIGRLGSIEIRRLIGRGGMGVVYEGWDPDLDRAVAVKVLSQQSTGDVAAQSRFLREAQAVAALDHPNVVTIHAIAEADGVPFLVLQLVDGESLAERIEREGPVLFDDIVSIGIQVARGLAAAHERGLIHRDIKPANILLDRHSSTARIADFGLAKQVGHRLTGQGVLAGTPAYMSPEATLDQPIDARSDLFGLGVVLYQASAGRLPFAAESPFVVLDQIRNSEPTPLRTIDATLPDWYCDIVHRLLAKRPEDRIATAAEVARLLEHRAKPAALPRGRFVKIAALAIAAAAMIALVFFVTWPAPTKVPTSGFVVTGSIDPFPTLATAIAAASDGAVIEVHGDGPFVSSTIKIEGKRLTIRANSESQPRFVPEIKGKGGPVQFLLTDSDLRLVGLEIDWPNPSPQVIGRENAVYRCVIGSAGGALTLEQCRVSCGESSACAGAHGGPLTISHCHLIAKGAAGFGWKPTPGASPARVEQNLIEGGVGGLIVSQSAPGDAELQLTRNTFVTERGMRYLLDSTPKQPLRIKATRNVFDNSGVISLIGLRGFPHNLSTSASMKDMLARSLTWSDDANVYRLETSYLTANRPNQILATVASDLRRLDDWLAFWKQSASPSAAAVIRQPNDGVPMAFEQATGPLPDPVGVDLRDVGPRRSDK